MHWKPFNCWRKSFAKKKREKSLKKIHNTHTFRCTYYTMMIMMVTMMMMMAMMMWMLIMMFLLTSNACIRSFIHFCYYYHIFEYLRFDPRTFFTRIFSFFICMCLLLVLVVKLVVVVVLVVK